MKTNTRQKLIEAGAAVMSAKSYHSAGLNEILAEVGVPKGSFYNYFSSKEDFGVAITKYFGDIYLNDTIQFTSDTSLSPRNRLIKLLKHKRDYFFVQGCNQGCFLAKLTTELAALNPQMLQALKEAFENLLKPYTECIREGQELGEFGIEHKPDELASFILNSWEGAVLMMQINQGPKPLDLCIDYIFEKVIPEKI